MKWRWWRHADEMATDFAKSRTEQSDDQFFADCGLPNTSEARRIALAVRRSVATYGKVAGGYLRTEDRYPDELIALSGWDSIDFMEWVFELEKELGEKLPSAAFKPIRGSFSIKDLVLAVYEYRCGKASS